MHAGGRFPARLLAPAAGIGTDLAMLVVATVAGAFLGAGRASVGADLEHLLQELIV